MNSSFASAHTASQLDELGFCIIPDAISRETCDELIRAVEMLASGESAMPAAGIRNLASRAPAVANFTASNEVTQILASLGNPRAFSVRSIFFDKRPGANWKVSWHQDLTIAVREKRDVPGFGPWSEKAGIPHVQPPPSILEQMLTLRLHLDDCDTGNGALRVIAGSHRHGILNPAAIQQHRGESSEFVCAVARGGILAMRPLLLHASSPAIRPNHRRVIHLEYAAAELPGGLAWFERGKSSAPIRQ